MKHVSRIDRVIALGLVMVLLALLGVALAHRSATTRSSTPTTQATVKARQATPDHSVPVATPTTSPPTSTTTTTTATTAAPTSTTAPIPVAGPVSAVGDSIMLDIQPYLAVDVPGAHIDGLVSRQFETGIGVVQTDRADGTLGRVLVVELGTNGTVTPSDFDAMMQAAAGVARVVFVNVNVPRSWEASDNAVLAAGVARYPGVAVLADWNTLSSGHPEWFTPDQVHLEPAGAQALADLVARYA
jgi:hypothetical protein